MTDNVIRAPLLPRYRIIPRCATPSAGIRLPEALRAEIKLQGLEVIEETVTDGNCGLHAFGLGLLEAGAHTRLLCDYKIQGILENANTYQRDDRPSPPGRCSMV